MTIINEINRLATYPYTFQKDGKLHLALLGGQSSCKISKTNYASTLMDLNLELQRIYEKGSFNDTDRIQIGTLMRRISMLCEGRLETNYTIEQQAEYLSTLPPEALKDIEKQIIMYKDARKYK